MFYFVDNDKAHMPFLSPYPGTGGSIPREFCCKMINGYWKVHQYKDGAWVKVNTGTPDDATECSPTAYCYQGKWHLTFIAGASKQDLVYRLYHIEDLDKETPPIIVCNTPVGFLFKSMITYKEQDKANVIIVETYRETYRLILKDVANIYRVSYDPFNPLTLCISGNTPSGEVFSRTYNIYTNELYDIKADDVPAYKATFWHDECFYARKTGEGFEDRSIVRATKLERIKLLTDDFISVEKKPVSTVSNHTPDED